MKKKVRIYKSPDGKGKFVNKTAKFLSKAQEGGQQDKQAQLADYVFKTLDDAEPFEFESIKESLINELASAQIPIDQAEGMVENIAAGLSNETAQADELAGQEEAGMYNQAQEDLRAQEEAAAAAEEERQAGLAEDYGYYDDTAAQGEDEEDEEDYDDEEESSYMQMGGDLIPEPNAVSFTGYDPEQYSQDTQNSFSKGGITKRKYIGSVMKMLKKQDGGEGEKDSQMDPMDTASNEKKRKKDAFIGALASSAKEAKMKEQAEAMWEQQQQAMMQQQAPQYPMQAPMEEVPMAQYGLSINHGGHIGQQLRGVSPRQMRRMMPRGFGRNQMQSFAGMVPQGGMFPMGMNIMTYPEMQMPEQKPIHVQGTPQGLKLDVRKSNWLTGRPSQYSIEFGGDAAIPGFNMMPGVGYGSKSKQRKTIEGVSKLVNKIGDPVNDINKDKAGYDVDGNGVPDNIQSNSISTTSNLSVELDKNRNGILDTTEVATNLPGVTTATNLNKDATGNGSKLPSKSATAKTNTATASKNVGQTKKSNLGQNLKEVTITGNKKALPKKADSYTSIPAGAKKATTWKRPASAYETGYNADDFGGVTDWLFNSSGPSKSAPAAPSSNSGVWNTVKNGLNFFYPGMGNLQDGGFVDSTNPDLYKFIYGGDEQFPDPITQQDMNYADAKNTASPYFSQGGMIRYQLAGATNTNTYDKDGNGVPDLIQTPGVTTTKKEETKKEETKKPEFQAITSKEDYDKRLAEERKNWQKDYAPENQQQYSQNGYRGYTGYPQNAFNRYFPANTIRNLGTYSQQMGMPYGADGAAYTGGFGPGTNLTKIDVRKSGWLSGKPRKYTMHFNNAEMDPTKPQFAINEGSAAPGSGDGSANTGSSWSPDELDTRKERRQARAHDKFIAEGWKMPDGEEEDVTEGGPSAEEIAARDAATLANKDVVREFSDVEGVQNDPFGIGSPTEEDLAEEDQMDGVTQDVSALSNANASGTQNYNQTQDMMSQLDEAGFNAQQDQLSRQDQEGARANMTQEEATNAMINNPFMPGYNPNQKMDPTSVQNRAMIEQGQIPPNVGANPEIAMGNFNPASGMQQVNQSEVLNNPNSFPNVFPNQERRRYDSMFEQTGDMGTLGQEEYQNQNPGIRNFEQYSDPFEGAASNDDMNLYGTMDGMSEGSVRNREIAAKQKYQQQQQAIKQQQIQQQQRQQQQIQAQKSGQNQSGSQGSNANAATLAKKAQNSNRQTKQAGNWVDTWDTKSIINKNKDQLETLKGSPTGDKTLFAIDTRWQNMPKAVKEKYGSYKNYLKVEGYDKFVNAMNSKQFGGDSNLNRFIYGDEVTKTSTGAPSPVVYTNNRAMEGLSDVDILTNMTNKEFTKPTTADSFMSMSKNSWASQDSPFNKPTLDQQTGCTEDEKKDPTSKCYDAEKYGMKIQEDALGSARETTKKTYAPKAGNFAVDFKNKNAYEVDAQGVLNSANAGARGALNFFEKRGQKKANKNFYDRFTADNLYASDPIRDRGDYEANSGLYRPDEQGQTWNSRSAKYGGFMQAGGFVEGDVVDMTQEEIEEFLANGGELEMIS
jgi:hypothetical protein